MAENETAPEKKSKINVKLILIVVGILAGAAVIALAVAKFIIAESNQSPGQAAFGGKAVVLEPGPLFDVGEFTTNLADPGGKRFLKAKITLEMAVQKTDEKKIAAIKERQPIIFDRILSILSSKTVAELQAVDGREKLKKEIVMGLNKQFGEESFRNVFFTELVYQ